ncbi:MAG: transcriptional regulator [Cruoricaptor ignavus]|nr:transcriptional regulator [Cruoricaptor ignavus]
MQKNLEIDETIFQNMVKFYGEIYNLPPLSAKIYAYLYFDFERKGLTFDELVDDFCASKSSISTSLQHLMNAKLINDISKIDERKRYFLINCDYVKIRFENIVSKLSREIQIIEDLEQFRRKKSIEPCGKLDVYRSLLERSTKDIQETINIL